MYKLIKDDISGNESFIFNQINNAFIPFDPANTDYQQFKSQINANEAGLQYADGALMTAEEAKAFVAKLP